MFFIKALKDEARGVDLPPDKDITNGNLKLNDMKCFESQKYRQPNHPRPQTPRTLPGNRKILYTTLISLLLSPVFLVDSCRKAGPDDMPDPAPLPARDTVWRTLAIRYAGIAGTATSGTASSGTGAATVTDGDSGSCLDLFIFDDTEGRPVDRILHFEGNPEEVEFRCLDGAKIVAAVANSPKAFNPAAIARYSSLDLIYYEFDEDDPGMPIMGGTCRLGEIISSSEISDDIVHVRGIAEHPSGFTDRPGREPVEVKPDEMVLTPLLCRICVESISNGLDGYELLEEPRVRLRNINGSAKLFNDGPYLPQEMIDYGEWVGLPYDIGMFTQELSIMLDCYPNESGEDEITAFRTELELECTIRGSKERFSFPIPEIGRASSVSCHISVYDEGHADCEFR